MSDYDRAGLIGLIKAEFKLDWHGIHGANHWARVLNHGKNIGQIRHADLLVVELFGFLHDSCRFDDGRDPKHGERAAEFAHGIHGDFYQLTPKQLSELCHALRHHSGGEFQPIPIHDRSRCIAPVRRNSQWWWHLRRRLYQFGYGSG